VAASIVAHGLTAQPLMQRYAGWRKRLQAMRERKTTQR
jgi:hypothetical protein